MRSCLYAVVTQLAKAELEKYNLTGWWPTFVTDAGGNVQRAFKGAGSSRVGGWLTGVDVAAIYSIMW